jgi:hypothetical protein
MNEPNKRPTYVPNNDLRETFSDVVSSVGFDGANLRIEMAVTRMGHNTGGRESTLHPSARLVLPLNAANELIQKLGMALADLEKQGVLRKGPATGQAPSSGPRN